MLRVSFRECTKNKSMIVSDVVIEAHVLKGFLKKVGNAAVTFGKKVAINPVIAIDIASNVGNSITTKKPSKVLS